MEPSRADRLCSDHILFQIATGSSSQLSSKSTLSTDTRALFRSLIREWPKLHGVTPNTVALLFFIQKIVQKLIN
jgi:hypothetical protein